MGDFTSDEQQYTGLMNSALSFAESFNIRPGIALSAEQVAQLTTDMVWLVEEEVTLADGSTQKVLVPKVYAVVKPGDLDGSGALMGGATVNINATQDLVNTGKIAGRDVVKLTADNIRSIGGSVSGNAVD